MSSDTYNDGRWHHVNTQRLNKDGLLRIDNIAGMSQTRKTQTNG